MWDSLYIIHFFLYREGSASPLTVGWAPTRPLGPPLVPTIIKAPKINRWSIVQPREWWLQGAPPSPASIWCNNKGLKLKRLSRGKLCQLVGFQVRFKTVYSLVCLWLWITKISTKISTKICTKIMVVPSSASIWCNNKGLKPKRLSIGKLCQLAGFQVRFECI